MSEMTYAVHTGTCTYLLDDEGICLWTLSPAGEAAAGTDRCVGAQFVACLDVRAAGGLVGELRIGACALFVRREHGRFVLLRTMPIDRVEQRGAMDEEARAHREAITAQDATAVLAAQHLAAKPEPVTRPDQTYPLPEHWAPPSPVAAAARDFAFANAAPPGQPKPRRAPAPPPAPHEVLGHHADLPDRRYSESAARTSSDHAAELDAEDLVSTSVSEVTLTMPLYRRAPSAPPDAADDAPPTPRGPPPAPPKQGPVPLHPPAPQAGGLAPPAPDPGPQRGPHGRPRRL